MPVERTPRQSDPDEMLDYLDELHRYLSHMIPVEPGTTHSDKTKELQGAVDKASDGDVIQLFRGYYPITSTITVDKRVRIQGPMAYGGLPDDVSGAVIQGTGTTLIKMEAPAHLDHLTIFETAGHTSAIGIDINNGASGVVKWKVSNCAIMGYKASGFGTLGTGIRGIFALTGVVENCTIEGWLNGIDWQATGASKSNANTVIGCKIRQNTIGVLQTSADTGFLYGNTIEANSTGSKLVSGKLTTVSNHYENNLGDRREIHVIDGNLVSMGNGFFGGTSTDKDIYIESGAGAHSSTGDTLNFGVKHEGTGYFSLQMPVLTPIVSGTGIIARIDGTGLSHLQGSSNLLLDPADDIQWGVPLVALGGGAAPTLGTIGGSGPATAAQNSWLRMLDSTGASIWVPVWK